VLGATLALAGDAAREELTPEGGSAAAPPRQAAKTRRTAKLPEPRFAAAGKAAGTPIAAPGLGAKKPKAARRTRPSPEARPQALKLPAPVTPAAEPDLASAAESAGANSTGPERPTQWAASDPAPISGPVHAVPAPPSPEPEPAADGAPVAAPVAVSIAIPVPAFAPAPPERPPAAAPAAAAEPNAPAAAPAPAAPAPTTRMATAAPIPLPAPATLPEAAPLAAAKDPPNPPPVAAASPPPPELAASPPVPQPPAVAASAEVRPSRAATLPQPTYGAHPPAEPAPRLAQTASAVAPTREAAAKPAPAAPVAHFMPPPAAAPSAPSADTPADPAPVRYASRNFSGSRDDLPVPAFGVPPPHPQGFSTAATQPQSLAQSLAQTQLQAQSRPAVQASALTAPIRANGGAAPGLGTGGPAPVISEDDELILQIETPQGEMSDTVVAYGLRQGVYLPLGALTRFFDLAISVSDDGHYASGWFLNEKRTITLNLRDGTLMIAGKPVPLGRADAVAYEGELYVRAERFGDLFPLDLKVDLRAQTIAVKTREPFPFEERMARESSRERLGSRSAQGPAQRFAREQTPWRALSAPLGEAELRALTDDDLGARVEADLRLAADLAFMTARAYASVSSRDGLTAARFELGRRDPDAALLGPLKATEFQLGDVSTGALPIGLRGISGRGAFITNAPLEQASIFDSVDLRGDLADGYEVELYRNNTLIGSTRTPVNGQYAFLQVPVDFGLNVFRLVFYGPQGQRREVVRRISVGDGRLSPGQFVYSVSAAQKDVNLFAVRGPQFSPAADYGAWRATAQLAYGLSRGVTASLGAGLWDRDGLHHWLATAGLRSGIGATALRLDVGVQDRGGHTFELGVGGKLLGMAYTLNHAEYGGGAGDEVRAFTADPLRRASELNLNTTLHFGSGPAARAMPLTSQIRHIEFADGRKETDAALRTSLPLGSVLVSNTFDYSALSAPGTASSHRLLGTFDLATLSGSRTRYRASLGYALAPSAKLQSATLEADRRFGESTLVRAGITHTLADHQTTLGLSAVRRIGPVNLAFDGTYGFPTRNFSLALRMGFSFGRNPLTGHMFVARPGLTGGGAIALRAFADANANGRFDPGEAPVAGVTFLSGTEESHSDANGRALVGSLGDGNRASIRVDADSMPDIALAPARPGIEIVPRPGRIHVSEFAIVTLSDIEGTAYFRAESGTRAVSRLQLRLLRTDGTVAARTRSESDGFFLFERLPGGDYHLELDPQQAAALKIRLEAPVALTLGNKNTVLRQSIYVKSAQ